MKIVLFILLLLSNQSAFCQEVSLFQHEKGIWAIQGTKDKNVWIIIHNLKEAQRTGIFHIEVVARKKNGPPWKVEHLVKHMAITEGALSASVLMPLEKGSVYPETFDTYFKEWRRQNSGKGGPVCSASIAECMNN